ncbi:hypothetical protein [Tellurirhabdus rosea]|uniref:hypothetical protein n=1 Tax=Tellurirhabdus rosea TaxID=2674997 RepID=UPI00224ED547|nr:hypothetical protein [Tellurirhabdus rosea]
MNSQSIYRYLLLMLLFSAAHDILFVYFNNPSGLSLNKVFFIVSFCLFFKLISVKNYINCTDGKSKIAVLFFFFYCLVTFVRGLSVGLAEGRLQNALNPVLSLCVIVPFAFFISFNHDFTFKKLLKVLLLFNKIGVALLPVMFVVNRGYVIPRPFIEASFFLFIFLSCFESKKERTWILAGFIGYLIVGIYSDNRSIVLRGALQVVFLLIFNYGEKLISRKVIKLAITAGCLALPIAFFTYYESFFQSSTIAVGSKSISNEDTRTFLYMDVLQELQSNDQIWTGKSTLGRYYSDLFFRQMGVDDAVDFYDRSIVEVGQLSYMLRGGAVLVILFTLLSLVSALTNLSSTDYFARASSYIILNHLLVSFIENIPKYHVYDILVWILIGYNISSRFSKASKQKQKHPVVQDEIVASPNPLSYAPHYQIQHRHGQLQRG